MSIEQNSYVPDSLRDTLRLRLRELRRDVSDAAATIRKSTETIDNAGMAGEFPG